MHSRGSWTCSLLTLELWSGVHSSVPSTDSARGASRVALGSHPASVTFFMGLNFLHLHSKKKNRARTIKQFDSGIYGLNLHDILSFCTKEFLRKNVTSDRAEM